ncbi:MULTISPECIES: FCD domain-containing protein [unclassified Streptomyces]|uniref:FadR/GntR family transcriptional regulator n=1 Tax=unclassified Streptomyces TaxID=2593676 RepID=UPI0036E09C54
MEEQPDSLSIPVRERQSRKLVAMKRVARHSAVDVVRNQLVELIERGEIPVGDWLPSEAEMSRAFGVSRPALREALGSLRAFGYIESQTGRGSMVVSNRASSSLTLSQYSSTDLNEVRRHLEVPTAKLAATRRSEEELAVIVEACEAYAVEADPEIRVRLDSELHIGIASATGNPLFPRLIKDIRSILEEQSLALSVSAERWRHSTEEHFAICRAIRDRDPDRASEAMVAHLRAVEDAVSMLQRPETPLSSN